MMKLHGVYASMLAAAVLAGCGDDLPAGSMQKPSYSTEIVNAKSEIIGEAVFSETEKGVIIQVKAENLEPGVKAIHIHETGKCGPPDFQTAGSHYNPKKTKHGFDNPKGYHAGDLPNITVSKTGKVNVKLTVPAVQLTADSLMDQDGSALVIHEKADDYKTDPAGNSGSRIACAALQGA